MFLFCTSERRIDVEYDSKYDLGKQCLHYSSRYVTPVVYLTALTFTLHTLCFTILELLVSGNLVFLGRAVGAGPDGVCLRES